MTIGPDICDLITDALAVSSSFLFYSVRLKPLPSVVRAAGQWWGARSSHTTLHVSGHSCLSGSGSRAPHITARGLERLE